MVFMIGNCGFGAAGANFEGSPADDKLESVLKEKLDRMDDDDKIDVSVWVTDIDRAAVKEKTASELEEAIEEQKINRAALSLLEEEAKQAQIRPVDDTAKIFSLSTGKLKAFSPENSITAVSDADCQYYIETERAVSSDLYQEQNKVIFDRLFPKQRQAIFESAAQKQPEILYACRYAPNIMMRLTKAQVYSMIESDEVLEVYLCEQPSEPPEETDFVLSDEDTSAQAYDNLSTVWQDVTGTSYLRDTLGMDGTGVKVGHCENGVPEFSNVTGVNCFAHMLDAENPDNNKIKVAADVNGSDGHATYTASLIVGKLGGYQGIVPNAELYCAGLYSKEKIAEKEGIEALVCEGVNVINCSYYFSYNNPISNNKYGDKAKWLDHIAVDHHVTLVISTGNYGSAGIPNHNMSYNAILVGNLDTKDTIDLSDDELQMSYDKNGNEILGSCSSYSNNTQGPFKPDLVAPGAFAACPYSPSASNGGTSAAAPVVTGAVAQLMQADPYLKTRPDLVKALLLCGTTHMSQNSNTGNASPAMDRRLGSGMLNVRNSYMALSTSSYPKYYTGTYGFEDNTQYHKTVLVNRPCDTLRIALTWNKTNSYKSISDHIYEGNLGMASLTRLKLTVVTPEGKTYHSISMTGNVQLISLPEPVLGTYHIYIDRINEFWQTTDFSVAVLNGDVLS